MKIPPIAIKSIKPYVKISKNQNILVALQLELYPKWHNTFSSFDKFIIKKRKGMHCYVEHYNSNVIGNLYGQRCKTTYMYIITKIIIKDIQEVPEGYSYKPHIISKTYCSTLNNKNNVVKNIKNIKLISNKDIAKMKLLRKF